MSHLINLRFKIVILGEGGVGKTTLSKSFEQNTIYQTTSQTIGVDIHVKHLKFEDLSCTIQLWDLGGQEHFKNMGVFPQFCEGAHGALVCFDLTDLETFNKLKQWIDLLPKKIPFIIIGTKADLENSASFLEIEAKKLSNNCEKFLQTRIDDLNSIRNAFFSLISKIIRNNYQDIQTKLNNRLHSENPSMSLNGTTTALYNESIENSLKKSHSEKEINTVQLR